MNKRFKQILLKTSVLVGSSLMLLSTSNLVNAQAKQEKRSNVPTTNLSDKDKKWNDQLVYASTNFNDSTQYYLNGNFKTTLSFDEPNDHADKGDVFRIHIPSGINGLNNEGKNEPIVEGIDGKYENDSITDNSDGSSDITINILHHVDQHTTPISIDSMGNTLGQGSISGTYTRHGQNQPTKPMDIQFPNFYIYDYPASTDFQIAKLDQAIPAAIKPDSTSVNMLNNNFLGGNDFDYLKSKTMMYYAKINNTGLKNRKITLEPDIQNNRSQGARINFQDIYVSTAPVSDATPYVPLAESGWKSDQYDNPKINIYVPDGAKYNNYVVAFKVTQPDFNRQADARAYVSGDETEQDGTTKHIVQTQTNNETEVTNDFTELWGNFTSQGAPYSTSQQTSIKQGLSKDKIKENLLKGINAVTIKNSEGTPVPASDITLNSDSPFMQALDSGKNGTYPVSYSVDLDGKTYQSGTSNLPDEKGTIFSNINLNYRDQDDNKLSPVNMPSSLTAEKAGEKYRLNNAEKITTQDGRHYQLVKTDHDRSGTFGERNQPTNITLTYKEVAARKRQPAEPAKKSVKKVEAKKAINLYKSTSFKKKNRIRHYSKRSHPRFKVEKVIRNKHGHVTKYQVKQIGKNHKGYITANPKFVKTI